MKFLSIIVVSLNSGERLKRTIDSIMGQTFTDYEVIIKDGGSTDGSLAFLERESLLFKNSSILLVHKSDAGIYDAMNQAVTYAKGRYIQFLNCGDAFYDSGVLAKTADYISGYEIKEQGNNKRPMIFYGNQYNLVQESFVTSAPDMNEFACYRNVPCHQVCFYDKSLFDKRSYLPKYTVRADYEHFLYCVYEEKAKTIYMPIVICLYEGGGFSETVENRRKSKEQHKEIVSRYMGKRAVMYRFLMIASFAGLRTKIAENPMLSKHYNSVKSFLYRRR